MDVIHIKFIPCSLSQNWPFNTYKPGVSVYSQTRTITTTDFRMFGYLSSNTVPIGGHSSPPPPGPWQPQVYFWFLRIHLFWAFVTNGITTVALCHRLHSPASILEVRPRHGACQSFLVTADSRVFCCVDGPHPVCPPVSDRPWLVLCGPWSHVVYTIWMNVCSVFGNISRSGIAGFMVTLCLTFWGTSKLF